VATTDSIVVVNVRPLNNGKPLKLIASKRRKPITKGPAAAILPLYAMNKAMNKLSRDMPAKSLKKLVFLIEINRIN